MSNESCRSEQVDAAVLSDGKLEEYLTGTGLEAGAKRAGTLHATIAFRPSFEQEAYWLARQNQEVELHATCLAWDGRAAALAFAPDVRLPAMPSTQRLHVTLALAPGVKPEYSNTMLADPLHREKTVDLLLRGTVTRHLAQY